MGSLALRFASASRPCRVAHRRLISSNKMPAVAQLAGTKPIAETTDGLWMIKITSPREIFVYKNAQILNISNIMPKYKLVSKVSKDGKSFTLIDENNLGIDEVKVKDSLSKNAVSPNDCIAIEHILGNWHKNKEPNGKNKKIFIIDVKIGKRTKSNTQMNAEEYSKLKRGLKILEHFVKDTIQNKSRKIGYDMENESSFQAFIMENSKNVQLTAALKKLISKLELIKKDMNDAKNITFVGSSILIAIDLDNPDSTDAKLIDPDHPIIQIEDESPINSNELNKNHIDNSMEEFENKHIISKVVESHNNDVEDKASLEINRENKEKISSINGIVTNKNFGKYRPFNDKKQFSEWFGKWRSEYNYGLSNLINYINKSVPNNNEKLELHSDKEIITHKEYNTSDQGVFPSKSVSENIGKAEK